MFKVHVDVADILARILSSAWVTVILGAVALIQTWRIASKNRKHATALAELQQRLKNESEKAIAAHNEHRVLADKVYRAAFNLHTAVRTLDLYFNQFHIHLGKARLLDDDIARVEHFLKELQKYGGDARRLGEKYLELLGSAAVSSLDFTSVVVGLHVFAERKGPSEKMYEMTDGEWERYRTSSASAINTSKQLVDEVIKILGEVEPAMPT